VQLIGVGVIAVAFQMVIHVLRTPNVVAVIVKRQVVGLKYVAIVGVIHGIVRYVEMMEVDVNLSAVQMNIVTTENVFYIVHKQIPVKVYLVDFVMSAIQILEVVWQ
jgi:hypothetical protein